MVFISFSILRISDGRQMIQRFKCHIYMPNMPTINDMNLASHYSLSLPPGRLHFAAHSHHPWPNATRDAVLQCWDDTARLLDEKGSYIFEKIWPKAQNHIARWIAHP